MSQNRACPPGGYGAAPQPECGETVRAQIAPNRWFVLAAQAVINSGLDGAQAQITWDHDGEVVGIRADAVAPVDPDLARTSLAVQITVGGAPPITAEVNGGGEAPILLSLLHTAEGPAPFRRRYKSGDVWYVMFHNYGAANYTPTLAFLVRADRP